MPHPYENLSQGLKPALISGRCAGTKVPAYLRNEFFRSGLAEGPGADGAYVYVDELGDGVEADSACVKG